jgi:hypothetical protein
MQRGFETHVGDRAPERRKPDMVAKLGAEYHSDA